MTGRRLRLVLLPALLAALAGCGRQSSQKTPSLAALPLVSGARITAQVRRCDAGASSYCGLELVVVAPRYRSSTDLLSSEHRLLHQLGWAGANADTGEQRAAESPGHKLRVTYATALGDLIGWDERWIKRPYPIALALDRELIDRVPAMSIMLEVGPT